MTPGKPLNGSHVEKTTQLITDQDKKKLKLGKEEAFKFLYPDALELTKPQPYVVVRNQSNSWVGRMPFTQAIKELFHGSQHFFVLAVPQGDGNLHIMKFIDNQGW